MVMQSPTANTQPFQPQMSMSTCRVRAAARDCGLLIGVNYATMRAIQWPAE